jgi:hypothetical protein
MQTVTACMTASSCTFSTNRGAHLVELWEPVCANGRGGQGIVQRLHQMAPPFLIWNVRHRVPVHLQDEMQAPAKLKASLAACQAFCTTLCGSKQVTAVCGLQPASWLANLSREVRQRVVSLHISETSSVPVRQGQQAQLVPSHHPELPLHEPLHPAHC